MSVSLSHCDTRTNTFFLIGKMESNTKTLNKESLKRAERRSNNRKKETTEQANNRKRKIAEKKTEKRKMERSEQGNNRKRINAEKMAENRKMESSEQGNNWKRKLLKKWQRSENWRHLNNIKKGLKKCLSILEAKKMGIIRKI
jgi:hypothetical protein